LCLGHNMTNRSLYAKQTQDRYGGQCGVAADFIRSA
jgi:hypothetical protein